MQTTLSRQEILKRSLIILPVLMAVIIVILLVRSQKGPEKLPPAETSHHVRVVTLQNLDVIPRVFGYGYVEPGQVWQVVPEVSGTIVQVSPKFKKGNFVKKDEVLLTIDPTNYRLAVRQTEADILNIKAQIAELDRSEANLRASLAIQQDLLNLKKRELDRNKVARKNNAVSESATDQAHMDYQVQKVQVQELENSLNLIPTSRNALNAQLAVNQAKLEEARTNLERTVITVPFDCRITETSAEFGQYVATSQTIAKADGIDRAEITAQIPMEKMPRLLAGVDRGPITASAATMDRLKMDSLKKIFDLKVRVSLVNSGFDAHWEARFGRADATIDAQTRTMGVIVVVDQPYDQIILGVRPPLVRNMFCRVAISGKPVRNQVVIPRSALHDGHVYVVDKDDRLRRTKVEVRFAQDDFYVITSGVTAGQRVVVSDIPTAMEGLLLAPIEDTQLDTQIAAQATGRTQAN